MHGVRLYTAFGHIHVTGFIKIINMTENEDVLADRLCMTSCNKYLKCLLS